MTNLFFSNFEMRYKTELTRNNFQQHIIWVKENKKSWNFLRILEVLDVINSLAKSIPFLLTRKEKKYSYSKDLKADPSKTGLIYIGFLNITLSNAVFKW